MVLLPDPEGHRLRLSRLVGRQHDDLAVRIDEGQGIRITAGKRQDLSPAIDIMAGVPQYIELWRKGPGTRIPVDQDQ